jgi:hypothetical protein
MMGLNYMANENNDSSDEPGEIIFSDPVQSHKENVSRKKVEAPETAKIISSGQPEPWVDLDTPSDTH